MATEVMGPNLKELELFCNEKFSTKTIVSLSLQMLNLLERLHSTGYVHNDIKPQNFVIGLNEKSNVLHLIDLGFSTRFINDNTKIHKDKFRTRHFVGTPFYASVNAHKGYSLSRRDDLLSTGHLLIHLLYPKLLKRHIHGNKMESLTVVKEMIC